MHKANGTFPKQSKFGYHKKTEILQYQSSKQQRRHQETSNVSSAFLLKHLNLVAMKVNTYRNVFTVFLTESQCSSSHRSVHAVPTPLPPKSRRIESVLGHVKLRWAPFTAVSCQLWSPETSERRKISAPVSHAALPGQWPHQVERGGCLWIHLLVAR